MIPVECRLTIPSRPYAIGPGSAGCFPPALCGNPSTASSLPHALFAVVLFGWCIEFLPSCTAGKAFPASWVVFWICFFLWCCCCCSCKQIFSPPAYNELIARRIAREKQQQQHGSTINIDRFYLSAGNGCAGYEIGIWDGSFNRFRRATVCVRGKYKLFYKLYFFCSCFVRDWKYLPALPFVLFNCNSDLFISILLHWAYYNQLSQQTVFFNVQPITRSSAQAHRTVHMARKANDSRKPPYHTVPAEGWKNRSNCFDNTTPLAQKRFSLVRGVDFDVFINHYEFVKVTHHASVCGVLCSDFFKRLLPRFAISNGVLSNHIHFN